MSSKEDKMLGVFAMALGCLLKKDEGIVVRDEDDIGYIVWMDGTTIRVRTIESDEVAYTEADMKDEAKDDPFAHGRKLWVHDE